MWKLHREQNKTIYVSILFTFNIYSGLQILVRVISITNATIHITVSTKNTSSPYLSTDNILISSPKSAYIVTNAINIENGVLSVILDIFLIMSD